MAKKIPADVAKVRERVKGVAGRGKAPRAKKRADRPGAKVLRANWRAAEERAADLRVLLATREKERDGYRKAVEECLAQDAAMKKELARLTSWLEEDRQRLAASNSVVEAQAKRIEELKASAPVLYVRELEAERDGLKRRLAEDRERSKRDADSSDFEFRRVKAWAEELTKGAAARIDELTAANLRLVDELVEAKKAAGGSGDLTMAFATIRDLRKELCDLRSAGNDMGILSVEVQDGCLVFFNGRRLACEVRSKGRTYVVPAQNRFVLHDASLAPDGKDWSALVNEWQGKWEDETVARRRLQVERDKLLSSQADHLRQIAGLQAAFAPTKAERDELLVRLREANRNLADQAALLALDAFGEVERLTQALELAQKARLEAEGLAATAEKGRVEAVARLAFLSEALSAEAVAGCRRILNDFEYVQDGQYLADALMGAEFVEQAALILQVGQRQGDVPA